MTKYPPRLTNVFKLVALLAELDRRSGDTLVELMRLDDRTTPTGMQLTLRVIHQLFRIHWDHTKVGWPIHLEVLHRLFDRYVVKGYTFYVVDNAPPDEEFLVDAIQLLEQFFEVADRPESGTSAAFWITVDMNLIQRFIKKHQLRFDDNWLLYKFKEIGNESEALHRDFFNIWTAPDALIKQSSLYPEVPNEEKP